MTRLVRDDTRPWRRTFDGVVVARAGDHETVALTGSAAAIWQGLAEPAAFDDLVARLAADHGVAPGAIRDDVATGVAELRDQGLLEER